ncbi:MAG: sigma-70 family RNA polymerase sigma factor, partial [Muribaculaceae bacterium]|nr:sigma-70 family RNA polymerase sigma factor [Muribaculaceae bacterium]
MSIHNISIDRFTSWNNEAFRSLYMYYYKALVNFSMQIVVSRDEAEDVVQSVFTVLLERKYRFATIESLEAFLYNSVRNQSLDRLRRQKVSESYVSSLEEQFAECTVDDGEGIYTEEVYRRLFDLIDQLPPKSREVFLLYIKGLTNQE